MRPRVPGRATLRASKYQSIAAGPARRRAIGADWDRAMMCALDATCEALSAVDDRQIATIGMNYQHWKGRIDQAPIFYQDRQASV